MELIDKAAVVAEIKGYISNYKEIVAKTNRNDSTWVDFISIIDTKIDVLQHVLFFLNTLEVKEVDFKKEIEEYLSTYWPNEKELYPFLGHMAKHFFAFGLKAKESNMEKVEQFIQENTRNCSNKILVNGDKSYTNIPSKGEYHP